MPSARTRRSAADGPLCVPYGLNFQNGGYCKDIIGNLPVYGSDIYELYDNEKKLRLYQVAKDFVLQTRENSTKGMRKVTDGLFEVRQSCLDAVDDIYCHYYFKRCYISSSPQVLCREACDELFLNLCDREYKMVSDFILSQTRSEYPFSWDIIDCKTLPFRNESSDCYYPDKIRGQYRQFGDSR